MEEILSHISLPVSLGAALISLVIGALWYHPKVFGTVWMKSIEKTEADLAGGNMAIIFGLTYVMSVVFAHFLQILIEFMHWHPDVAEGVGYTQSFRTFPHGAFHGAMIVLLLVTPVTIINSLFERRSFKYMLIHIGYWVVVAALMGGIVDAF